jgi:hypothetical protein
MSIFKRIDKTIDRMGYWGWFIEQVVRLVTSWTILSGIAAGAVMTYLSSITEWLAVWGPVAWGGIGIGVALTTMLAVSRARLWASSRTLSAATERLVDARTQYSGANPLAKTFEHERINLHDLTTPLSSQIRGKTFVGCQIVGPVNVLLFGSTNIVNPQGLACEAVYADNDVFVTNAVQVYDCDFRDCEFFNVTFTVLPEQYDAFSNALGVSWITKNPKKPKPIRPRIRKKRYN